MTLLDALKVLAPGIPVALPGALAVSAASGGR